MGISGLYTLLKSIQNPCHLQSFAGKTVAIDGYAWLHRAAISCATQLALGQPTNIYVRSIMNRVRMLLRFGVTPYFVFDGDYLPSKQHTEKGRSENRDNAKRLGSELLALGRTKQAHQALSAAVDVTPEMAAAVIHELKRHQIAYVVAPYEADAQLAYLERQGHVDAVLAEDSDLLVFGVSCLITKLDQHGNCVVFERKKFAACRGASLAGWSDKDFRHMAILSGCDYLPNLKSIGLTRAHSLMRRHKTIEKVLQFLKFEGKIPVPQDYLARFMQADRTFLYQLVFCPKKQELVHLNTLESSIKLENMPFLGKLYDPEVAAAVARGELHPNTRQPLIPYPSQQSIQQHRHGQYSQADDSVKSKPIESFFKAKHEKSKPDLKNCSSKIVVPGRIPLAELDPNSFALTTKQEHVQRPSVVAPQTPRTSHSDKNAPVFSSSTIRSYQPIARSAKRLCFEDTSSEVSESNLKSRYFSTPRQKKRKPSADFLIHSDGSEAEAIWAFAVSNMPHPDSGNSSNNKPGEEVVGDDLDATLFDNDEAGDENTLVENLLYAEKSVESKTRIFQKYSSVYSQETRSRPTSSTRKRKASLSPDVSAVARFPSPLQTGLVTESACKMTEELVAIVASDPVEPPSPALPGKTAIQCGSEDLLASESEDGGSESPLKKVIDLTKFAYQTVNT